MVFNRKEQHKVSAEDGEFCEGKFSISKVGYLVAMYI